MRSLPSRDKVKIVLKIVEEFVKQSITFRKQGKNYENTFVYKCKVILRILCKKRDIRKREINLYLSDRQLYSEIFIIIESTYANTPREFLSIL